LLVDFAASFSDTRNAFFIVSGAITEPPREFRAGVVTASSMALPKGKWTVKGADDEVTRVAAAW
jgi:hypothetical protein